MLHSEKTLTRCHPERSRFSGGAKRSPARRVGGTDSSPMCLARWPFFSVESEQHGEDFHSTTAGHGRRYGKLCCTYTVVVIINKYTRTYVHWRTLLSQIPILGQKIHPLAPGDVKKPARSICRMPRAASTAARRATRSMGLAPTTLAAVKVRQRAFKTRSTKNQQLPPTFNDFHQLSTT